MGKTTWLGAFVAVACGGLAAGAGGADALIVAGRGATGVALGDSRESVVARLGKPESAFRSPGPKGFRRSSYSGVEIYTDELSSVFMVVVTGRKEALPNGIKVGSSLARLKGAYRGSLGCQGEDGHTSSCSLVTPWRLAGFSAQLSTTEFLIDQARKVERIAIFRGASR